MLFSFIELSIYLTFIGAAGVVVNKRNILLSVISIELMFYGVNLFLTYLAVYIDDVGGEILSLFVLTLAAAESALALALIMSYFRIFENILITEN